LRRGKITKVKRRPDPEQLSLVMENGHGRAALLPQFRKVLFGLDFPDRRKKQEIAVVPAAGFSLCGAGTTVQE